MTYRLLARSLAISLLAVAALAQDTSTTPIGGSFGASFDERATADHRIQSVTVHVGAFVDGLRLTYERRNGTTHGISAQIANTSGTANEFAIPDGDYLRRIDIWYSAFDGYLTAIRLRTRFGFVQTYGLPSGTQHNMVAPPGEEIVGLLGNGTALVSALGITTRPVLASHVFFGTGCASNLGQMEMRYRSGYAHLIMGTLPIVDVTNVPLSFALIAVGFTPLPGGVSLAGFGAPGCSLYQSLDDLIVSGAEPNQTAGYGFLVPNNSTLIGAELTFQGASFGAPNAMNLATSNAIRCMIGAL